jgi:hypothetical protein
MLADKLRTTVTTVSTVKQAALAAELLLVAAVLTVPDQMAHPLQAE